MKVNAFSKALLTSVAVLGSFSAYANATRVDQILERLNNANDHRDHVMIVAHRGLWNKEAKPAYPEQSIYSINRAIEAGVEVVEVDVRQSKDGAYVVVHDEILDGTTTCSGLVAEKNLKELKDCRLVITTTFRDDDGIVTDEQIPTLEEVYVAIKDKVLLNLDNKVGIPEFPEMFALAQEVGVDHQILATINQNTEEQQDQSAELVEQFRDTRVNFLPNLYDSHVGLDVLEASLEQYTPPAVQLRNYHQPGAKMTADGGIYFTEESLKLAEEYNAHYWVNTIYANEPGMRSGGRGDEMAIYADLPADVFGFWADKGVTMFQTDEPEIAIQWLEENGYRKSYN